MDYAHSNYGDFVKIIYFSFVRMAESVHRKSLNTIKLNFGAVMRIWSDSNIHSPYEIHESLQSRVSIVWR